MKFPGYLAKKTETAKSKDKPKEVIKEVGVELNDDDELENVSGGRIPPSNTIK